MTVHTTTCLWVLCDGKDCDRDKGWRAGEEPRHFESELAALAFVLGNQPTGGAGWTQLSDGRLLCRRCSVEAECADKQWHRWNDWLDDPAEPLQFRRCLRCGAYEERHAEIGGT